MSGSWNNWPLWPFVLLLLLAAAALAAGCSTSGTSDSGGGISPNHVPPSGSSVSGWTNPAGGSLHAIAATQEYASKGMLVSCPECHGTDLSGGTSRVSCIGNPAGCHHGTIAGWDTPQVHGAWAKRAPGDGSLFSCRICHGASFSGGRAQASCFTCHGVDAPHPPGPWGSGTGTTHANTDASNALVCAQCHYLGSPNNPAGHPATPAPAGTSPGCYNGTMCHNDPFPPGTHGSGWLNVTAPGFHANSIPALWCFTCHPIPGHPDCSTCHFGSGGKRIIDNVFDHLDPLTGHRNATFMPTQKEVCENCHQTSRRYRSGSPSTCGPTVTHPGDQGCHYNGPLLDPVFADPRY